MKYEMYADLVEFKCEVNQKGDSRCFSFCCHRSVISQSRDVVYCHYGHYHNGHWQVVKMQPNPS